MRSRAQLLRLFRKHWGESARLARELDLKPATISRWLHGHFDSDRIEAAVLARVDELLEKEAQKRATEDRIKQKLTGALAKVQAS